MSSSSSSPIMRMWKLVHACASRCLFGKGGGVGAEAEVDAEEGAEEGVEKCVGVDLKKNEVMLGCEGSERGRLPDALGVVPTDAPSTSTSSPTSQVDTAPGVEYGSM